MKTRNMTNTQTWHLLFRDECRMFGQPTITLHLYIRKNLLQRCPFLCLCTGTTLCWQKWHCYCKNLRQRGNIYSTWYDSSLDQHDQKEARTRTRSFPPKSYSKSFATPPPPSPRATTTTKQAQVAALKCGFLAGYVIVVGCAVQTNQDGLVKHNKSLVCRSLNIPARSRRHQDTIQNTCILYPQKAKPRQLPHPPSSLDACARTASLIILRRRSASRTPAEGLRFP